MPTLNWLGKDQAIKTSASIPYRILEHQPELSYGDEDNQNILIQGDNLEALKALLPFYAGQVKCIYIDPPYNTQNAFEHYDDNLEHSTWLSLMYPRLELLREFLLPDGTIWISIDDDEGHYLKVLCDDVFGRNNFVNTIIWQKKHTRSNDAKYLSDNHDFILCYAREKVKWNRNFLVKSEKAQSNYKNPDNDPRGLWSSQPIQVKTPSDAYIYEIVTPYGRSVFPPEGRSWQFSKARYEELVEDNRIYFGKDGKNVPRIKKFKYEVQEGLIPLTIWFRDEVGDNQEAKTEVKKINPISVFSTPKPERLMERIIQIASNEGDIVMDSFLGSGTTCAVAQKMHRNWIGIEMGDHAVTHCAPRLQKVIDGEQGGISETMNWKGGGGYRFYKLGNPIFDAEGKIHPEVRFVTLANHIWFSETGFPLTNKEKSALLGIHNNVAYYLLFNGILGDKTINGGNVLTTKVLKQLPQHEGPKVIYGELTKLGANQLQQLDIAFKQIPYDVKAR